MMHVHRLNAAAALLWAVCLGYSAQAQSEVVFDNTSNLDNRIPNFFFAQEYGDELYLSGTARVVTEFKFAYYADLTSPSAGRYSVRIYANDGSDALPGASTALRPKSLLYESGSTDLANGANRVTLPIPNILVPDHLTWTVQFTGVDGSPGKHAALMLADPATVGAVLSPGTPTSPPVLGSYNDFWKKDNPSNSESWTLYDFQPSPTKANFYAKVSATLLVPELKIARAAQSVTLSWPAAAADYVLEGSDGLSAPGSWVKVPAVPNNVNGTNLVTQSTGTSRQFYRLRHP